MKKNNNGNFNIKNVSITYDIYDKEAQKRFEEL